MSEDIGRPLFSGYQASSGLGRPATLRDMDQPHGIEKVERHSERHQEQQMTPSSDGVRQGCPPMKRGRNIHVHRDRRIVARIPSGDLAGPRGRAGSEQEEPRERTDALANRTNLEPSQPLGDPAGEDDRDSDRYGNDGPSNGEHAGHEEHRGQTNQMQDDSEASNCFRIDSHVDHDEPSPEVSKHLQQ